jgi:hypothetical protein
VEKEQAAMHPELDVMIRQREQQRELRALLREGQMLRALDGQTRSTGARRALVAALCRVLRMVEMGLAMARGSGLDQDAVPVRGANGRARPCGEVVPA